jgi:hypothetical protein
MGKIKRYDLVQDDYGLMVEHEQGDWVTYEDYARVTAEREKTLLEIIKSIQKLEEALKWLL